MGRVSDFLEGWEGVRKGEIILFYVSNSVRTMLFFTACFQVGVVPANASIHASPGEGGGGIWASLKGVWVSLGGFGLFFWGL